MTARVGRVAAVCFLLAFAGCVGPGGDGLVGGAAPTPPADAGTTTEGIPEYVTVEGDLAVDANRTFRRVESLVGEEYGGTRVVVRDLTSYKTGDLAGAPFFRAFGVGDPALDPSEPAGLTSLDATVYVSPASAGPERVEQVLAHEFVHVAQVREGMVPWLGGLSLGRTTLDERFARRALVEGGAVFVTDAYTRAYQPDLELQSTHVAESYREGSAGNRFVLGQYVFGARYVAATIDDPDSLERVYDDPPETSENVLHPGERDALVPLDVSVEDEAYDRVRSPTGRAGEFVARIVLRQTTHRSTAVEASTGWGNDRVVAFDTSGRRSIAWVTRWDTPGDATEFAAAARTLDEQRVYGYDYRVEQVSEDTVVVFAGTDAFVETAEASGNVTVAV